MRMNWFFKVSPKKQCMYCDATENLHHACDWWLCDEHFQREAERISQEVCRRMRREVNRGKSKP